jgi:hypothetical protein
MTNQRIGIINNASFIICLASILCGMIVGALGMWGAIPTADAILWRALGTCGVLFFGSIFASMAIRCFKTNE